MTVVAIAVGTSDRHGIRPASKTHGLNSQIAMAVARTTMLAEHAAGAVDHAVAQRQQEHGVGGEARDPDQPAHRTAHAALREGQAASYMRASSRAKLKTE